MQRHEHFNLVRVEHHVPVQRKSCQVQAQRLLAGRRSQAVRHQPTLQEGDHLEDQDLQGQDVQWFSPGELFGLYWLLLERGRMSAMLRALELVDMRRSDSLYVEHLAQQMSQQLRPLPHLGDLPEHFSSSLQVERTKQLVRRHLPEYLVE